MRYYFAPLEGLTDSIYRQVHSHFFPGLDRYYTPFFSPTIHRTLTNREQRELPFADAVPYCVVPQILTKIPEDFLWMAQQCAERGYREVNLNLGCPSGTVTAKGKGAAMLAAPEALDRFLEEVFSKVKVDVSIKTRIGYNTSDEFSRLLEIFNRYPVCELTVHPRVRTAFYHDPMEPEVLRYAVENSRAPVCINGNLCTLTDVRNAAEAYPKAEAVMLGRGLIGDPGMFSPGGTDVKTLKAFMDTLLDAYIEAFGGARNAMFRLKENWYYLLCRFENSEKLGKRLRKTTDLEEFRRITEEIFGTLPLADCLHPCW